MEEFQGYVNCQIDTVTVTNSCNNTCNDSTCQCTNCTPNCPPPATAGSRCCQGICEATCDEDSDCPSGYYCDKWGGCNCKQIPQTCSGSIILTLSPTSTSPGGSVVPSAGGIAGCPNKTIYFKKDSCSGTQVSYCNTGSAGTGCQGQAFSAPSATGTYTYYACIDKNGDGDYADSGERDSEVLTVTTASCSCTSWTNQGCGQGGCASNEMYQTRTCTPANCDVQSQCVPDSSCEGDCSTQCSNKGFATGTCSAGTGSPPPIFGNGTSSVVISTTTTFTTNKEFLNLTINPGVTLYVTSGIAIKVKGKLTVQGTISGTGKGAGCSQNGLGTDNVGGEGGRGGSWTYGLGGNYAGGGGGGYAPTCGLPGNGGSYSGGGGRGGYCTGLYGPSCGRGGAVFQIYAREIEISSSGKIESSGSDGQNASGEEGGGKGGGGGGGGGRVYIYFGSGGFKNYGIIEAKGGKGGNGSGSSKGGGGGGGGYIKITGPYQVNLGMVNVNGGAGGNPDGTAGTAGSAEIFFDPSLSDSGCPSGQVNIGQDNCSSGNICCCSDFKCSKPPSYPTSTWDRVWCDKNFSTHLADTPDQDNTFFDENWGTENVGGIRPDNIGFRSGRTIFLPAGSYEFRLGSDDGSKLWIDEVLCIDNWGDHGYEEKSCNKTFNSPGTHRFRIDYYEKDGPARVKFYMNCPSEPLSYPTDFWDRIWCAWYADPPSYLISDLPDQPNLLFDDDWGSGNVGGISNHDIGFRSGRTVYFATGTYVFTLGSDDGSKLWIDGQLCIEIDGQLCIDNWGVHGYQEKTCIKNFSTAGTHKLRIDYFQKGGAARVKFSFSALPTAQNLTVDASSSDVICGQTTGSKARFCWQFFDPDGGTQSAYQIQVDDNSDFSSPVLNTGKLNSPSQCFFLQPPYQLLEWNKHYYWKLMVWDNQNTSSNWILGPEFTTPHHSYPAIDFEWQPKSSTINQIVEFENLSNCYDNPGTTTCSKLTGDSFLWQFEGGNPPNSDLENPTTTFSTMGEKEVSLKVTDSSGYFCEKIKKLKSTYPLPKWKEIPPFSWLEKFLAAVSSFFDGKLK